MDRQMKDWAPIFVQLRWHIAIGVVVSSMLGWLAFMVADNTPPYVYDSENSFIKPAQADDGAQITVMWKIKTINRICPGASVRTLFDPKTKVILASYDPAPAAISSSISSGYLNRTFQLPRSVLPPGQIGYRATVCYECNLYQKLAKPLCITTPDLFFEVKGEFNAR
jgi:hypothetical protein